MSMIEDPEGVTVERLVLDIIANPGQEHKAPSMLTTHPWIAPSPTVTRLRLFCLPYAGGVSENVFARQALPKSTICIISIMRLIVMLGEVVFLVYFFETTQGHCPSISTTGYATLDGTSNHIGKQIKCEYADCRWAMMMPPSIQVCPVEIPGRGRRDRDAPLTDVANLAKALARALPLQV